MSALAVDRIMPVVITGGAGFIGTNLASRLLEADRRVLIFDDFSGRSAERNAAWLRDCYGNRVDVLRADVRDRAAVASALGNAFCVFHLAAPRGVRQGLTDPFVDFEVNAGGTLNVLEAIRATNRTVPLIFASTKKVYGSLNDVSVEQVGERYLPVDLHLREGFGEEWPLQFEDPSGCSKGAADQYVLDYARAHGLAAVVFRMSSVYGPRQVANEDQGWVTHFLMRAFDEGAITLYGDGAQVRDILYVDDLVDAFLRALWLIRKVSGQAFNIGGGVTNATTPLELVDRIRRIRGRRPRVRFEPWRVGDPRYYVSDTRKFTTITGWTPRVGIDEGLRRVTNWLTVGRHEARAEVGGTP